MADYEVLYDKLLVERIPEEELVEGWLHIPAAYQQKQSIGTVLEVGAGRLTASGSLLPLQVKAGDTVLFNKFSGAELPTGKDDAQLLILREDEVLARVKKPKEPQLKAV